MSCSFIVCPSDNMFLNVTPQAAKSDIGKSLEKASESHRKTPENRGKNTGKAPTKGADD